MKSNFLRTVSIVTATALLVGCGSSGGSDSVTSPDAPTQSQGTAPANKGPFALGSTVTAYKLNSDGSRSTETNSTKTTDDKGTFTISVPWEGPTELNIVGEYLNETTGTYMNDGDLSAIVDMKSSGNNSLGINIFTHMAASVIRNKMASSSGVDFSTLKEESKEVIANQFNLKLDADTALEDLDVTSSDEDANVQLLQISAALMNTPNPTETLANISEDLSDGEVDDEGQAALQELDEEMEQVDIVAVAQNIENNVEGSSAPQEFNVLNGTLSWDSNIAFASLNDAPLNTQQTSSLVTVDGVIGESAALSIANGSYILNGAVVSNSNTTVRNGDKLALIGTSSLSYNSESKVVVTIGGEAIPFIIRTQADPNANDDAVPNAFDFGFKKNIAAGTSVSSDEVIVSGINTATSISIDNGTFTVNGSSASEVNSGDKVVVTLTSGALGETKKATVTIGGVEGKFVVSSEAKDSMPLINGSFQSVAGVEKATAVISNEIEVTDINVEVPVSISGGELSINGGEFTTSAKVSSGDKVKVRMTSANDFDSKKEVSLNVGSVVVPFITQTKSNPVVPDKVPNSFSFNAQTTRVANTPINSQSITVSSINEAVAISIVDGKYSVNGGTFTSAPSTVNEGDKVVVQVVSADYGSSEKARVTIGGISATFLVSTIKDDTLDPISFNAREGVGRNLPVESDSVTISGINVPMPVTVVGGEYSIDGAEYVSSAGTITEGQTVKVRVTSSSVPLASKSAILSVGSLQLPFVVTTQASIPPVSSTDTIETAEDTMVVIDVLSNDSDEDADTLSIVNLSTPAHGTVRVVNGKVNYTPSQDFVGTDTFTYQASDGMVRGNPVTVTVTVTPVNDAPLVEDKAVTVAEDAEHVITLTATDVDGDKPTFTIVDQPTHGTVTLAGALATYVPNKDYVGSDSFTYSASDESETSNTATINITVTNVGDAPVLTAINDRSMDEDSAPITIALAASDIDGDSLTFEATSSDETKATVAVVGSTLIVTALPNMSGDVTISVTAADGTSTSSTETFTLTINPINDAPVLESIGEQSISQGQTSLIVNLVATDIDSENITFEASSSDGSQLSTTINGNQLILTPETVTSESVLITVTASDDEGASDTVDFAVNLLPVNQEELVGNVLSQLFSNQIDEVSFDVGVETSVYEQVTAQSPSFIPFYSIDAWEEGDIGHINVNEVNITDTTFVSTEYNYMENVEAPEVSTSTGNLIMRADGSIGIKPSDSDVEVEEVKFSSDVNLSYIQSYFENRGKNLVLEGDMTQYRAQLQFMKTLVDEVDCDDHCDQAGDTVAEIIVSGALKDAIFTAIVGDGDDVNTDNSDIEFDDDISLAEYNDASAADFSTLLNGTFYELEYAQYDGAEVRRRTLNDGTVIEEELEFDASNNPTWENTGNENFTEESNEWIFDENEDGTNDFKVKYIKTLTASELDSLDTRNIFGSEVVAYELRYTNLHDKIDFYDDEYVRTYGSLDKEFYESLEEFIGSQQEGRWFESKKGNHGGIAFANGSTGESGNLVEVNENGDIVTANAGTWSINDDDILLISVNSDLGYGDVAVFKSVIDDNGNERVLRGEFIAAGSSAKFLWFNEAGKDDFLQYLNDNELPFYVNNDDNNQALESDRIVGTTQYFVNSSGTKGYRTYSSSDNTYTGHITLANGTDFDVSGTYGIEGNVVTINRTTPNDYALTLSLTYRGDSSGAMAFDVTAGENSSSSLSFTTEEARDTYINSLQPENLNIEFDHRVVLGSYDANVTVDPSPLGGTTMYNLEFSSYGGNNELEIEKYFINTTTIDISKLNDDHTTWRNDGNISYSLDNNEFFIDENNDSTYDFKIKYVGNIDIATLNSIAGKTIFTTDTEAYRFMYKQLVDKVEFYSDDNYVHSYDNTVNEYYTSIAEFIEHQQGEHWFNSKDGNQGGISFASGSIGNSVGDNGTLIEVNANGETITENAGTWEINTDNILVVTPNMELGYRASAFKVVNNNGEDTLLEGDYQQAGEEEEFLWFNETGKNQFLQFLQN